MTAPPSLSVEPAPRRRRAARDRLLEGGSGVELAHVEGQLPRLFRLPPRGDEGPVGDGHAEVLGVGDAVPPGAEGGPSGLGLDDALEAAQGAAEGAHVAVVAQAGLVDHRDAAGPEVGAQQFHVGAGPLARRQARRRQHRQQVRGAADRHQVDAGGPGQPADAADQIGGPAALEGGELLLVEVALGGAVVPQEGARLRGAGPAADQEEPEPQHRRRADHGHADHQGRRGETARVGPLPPGLVALPEQGRLQQDRLGAGVDLAGQAVDPRLDPPHEGVLHRPHGQPLRKLPGRAQAAQQLQGPEGVHRQQRGAAGDRPQAAPHQVPPGEHQQAAGAGADGPQDAGLHRGPGAGAGGDRDDRLAGLRQDVEEALRPLPAPEETHRVAEAAHQRDVGQGDGVDGAALDQPRVARRLGRVRLLGGDDEQSAPQAVGDGWDGGGHFPRWSAYSRREATCDVTTCRP